MKAKEDKLNQLLGDYQTEADAHEAYGYDLISWEEYESICAALEGNAEKADVDDVEIVMSRIFSHLANDTLKLYQTLKYESLSDEEKAEWDRQIADYKAKVEARKIKERGATE